MALPNVCINPRTLFTPSCAACTTFAMALLKPTRNCKKPIGRSNMKNSLIRDQLVMIRVAAVTAAMAIKVKGFDAINNLTAIVSPPMAAAAAITYFSSVPNSPQTHETSSAKTRMLSVADEIISASPCTAEMTAGVLRNSVNIVLRLLDACSNVFGNFLNSASTPFAALIIALAIMSEVILPSEPSSFKSPTFRFISVASAFMTKGSRSEIDLNSSPASLPEAKPWLN